MKIRSFTDTISNCDSVLTQKLEFIVEVRYPNAAPRLVSLQTVPSENLGMASARAFVAGLPLETIVNTANLIIPKYDVRFHHERISGKVQITAESKCGSKRKANPQEAMLAMITELPLAESEMVTFLKMLKEVLFSDILSETDAAREGEHVFIDQVSVNGNVIKVVIGSSAFTREEMERRETTIKERLRRMESCR